MRRQIWGSLLQSTRVCYRQMYCTKAMPSGHQISSTMATSTNATAVNITSEVKDGASFRDGEVNDSGSNAGGSSNNDSGVDGGSGVGGGDNGNGKDENPKKWIGMTPLSDRLHPNQKNAVIDSQKAIEQFLDVGSSAGARRTGRAWRISELRLKSFDDLHRLWYILLKERNVLLTEKAWCKTNGRYWANGPSNMTKVRTSMARVKTVLAERGRANRKRLIDINAAKAAEAAELGADQDGDDDGDIINGQTRASDDQPTQRT